jgi:hypothetical protein
VRLLINREQTSDLKRVREGAVKRRLQGDQLFEGRK